MINARNLPVPLDLDRAALFLDFDGTLIEFAETPMGVVVNQQTRQLLASLTAATEGACAIITGRELASLDTLLTPLELPASGIHGLERRDVTGKRCDPGIDTSDELELAREHIRDIAQLDQRVLVEDKRVSLTVHFRRCPELGAEIAAAMSVLSEELSTAWQVEPGQLMYEVRSTAHNKGTAIAAFMQENPFRGRQPVYFGDDKTDEDGFRTVNAMDGITVKVGEHESEAGFRLPDVDAVNACLQAALEELNH